MFSLPVDETYQVGCPYGEKGKRFAWSIDEENGLWIPLKAKDGLGMHCGTDFSCPPGVTVRSMVDGFIVRARHENALDLSYGEGLHIVQLVTMPGYDSWALKYSHLSEIFVAPGQSVKRHQPIGRTGRPHLHVDLMNLKRQWRAIVFES